MPELGDLKIRISIRKDLAEMAVLYVGSYTQGIDGALTGSEGIYAFHLNEGTGVVSLLQTVKNVTNPSFWRIIMDIYMPAKNCRTKRWLWPTNGIATEPSRSSTARGSWCGGVPHIGSSVQVPCHCFKLCER